MQKLRCNNVFEQHLGITQKNIKIPEKAALRRSKTKILKNEKNFLDIHVVLKIILSKNEVPVTCNLFTDIQTTEEAL